MNRSFIKILVTGAIALSVLAIVSSLAIALQSINLLRGVSALPQGAAFVPTQAPAMVSILANPEKLYGIRQVTLPLKKRQSDRQQWQQWSRSNFKKLGLDYHGLKPWLGNELTLAITALDYDRNFENGVQPGYLFIAEIRNARLAKESLNNYSQPDRVAIEHYKGADIVTYSPQAKTASSICSNAIVGNWVLFANNSQIIREAINQAQAVDLNLEHSDDYQAAIASITQPRIAIAYIDVSKTLAWLNKLGVVEPNDADNHHLAASLAIENRDLVARSVLDTADPQVSLEIYKSLLDNPELEPIVDYLFPGDRSTYIDLTNRTNRTASSTDIRLYQVIRLAIKGLFPHVEAISVENRGIENNLSRTKILFKLDA